MILDRTAHDTGQDCRERVIPLYVETAALGHINTTWGMLSKTMGMTRDESKQSRLQYTKIAALQLSHLPVRKLK